MALQATLWEKQMELHSGFCDDPAYTGNVMFVQSGYKFQQGSGMAKSNSSLLSPFSTDWTVETFHSAFEVFWRQLLQLSG